MAKAKKSAAHPGEVLKEMYLDPWEITVTHLADNIGVTRKTISQLVNGRMGISAEMALRLSKALDTPPQYWLNAQHEYDLSQIAKTVKLGSIRSLAKKRKPAKKK